MPSQDNGRRDACRVGDDGKLQETWVAGLCLGTAMPEGNKAWTRAISTLAPEKKVKEGRVPDGDDEGEHGEVGGYA